MKPLFALILLLFVVSSYGQQKAYYRTPAIYDNMVVFTAEGDLWKFDINTNQSTRLTTHHGTEIEPLISPDGKSIVFTGQYEGPTELYMISIDGGVPQRLTFENMGGIRPIGWTQDGRLLYTTLSESPLIDNQLAKLNLQTLATELVPLFQAADGTYDSEGNLYFTRFAFQGSQTKRYKGGTAKHLEVFR